jgi:hypothetical protein
VLFAEVGPEGSVRLFDERSDTTMIVMTQSTMHVDFCSKCLPATPLLTFARKRELVAHIPTCVIGLRFFEFPA